MRWNRLATSAATVLLPLAGCQPNDGPPSIRFGEEVCAQCRMIISDDRFAAALTAEDGESAKFDDVGCMVEHEEGGFRPSSAYWVRDFQADAWLDAREASFARSKSIASPMGFGVAALPTPPDARGFHGDPQARIARFNELPRLIASEAGGDPSAARP